MVWLVGSTVRLEQLVVVILVGSTEDVLEVVVHLEVVELVGRTVSELVVIELVVHLLVVTDVGRTVIDDVVDVVQIVVVATQLVVVRVSAASALHPSKAINVDERKAFIINWYPLALLALYICNFCEEKGVAVVPDFVAILGYLRSLIVIFGSIFILLFLF